VPTEKKLSTNVSFLDRLVFEKQPTGF